MAKKPTFGSGVLFRNKKKLDQLSITKTTSSEAFENSPDLTGTLEFTKSEANALMQFLKAEFGAGKENNYGKIQVGFAATIRNSDKAGDYLSTWCSEPYKAEPKQEAPQAVSKAPDLDDDIPF